jgi:hypothetical protein
MNKKRLLLYAAAFFLLLCVQPSHAMSFSEHISWYKALLYTTVQSLYGRFFAQPTAPQPLLETNPDAINRQEATHFMTLVQKFDPQVARQLHNTQRQYSFSPIIHDAGEDPYNVSIIISAKGNPALQVGSKVITLPIVQQEFIVARGIAYARMSLDLRTHVTKCLQNNSVTDIDVLRQEVALEADRIAVEKTRNIDAALSFLKSQLPQATTTRPLLQTRIAALANLQKIPKIPSRL